MQHDLPARWIVVEDQRPRVVEQHFLRHTPVRPKRALHPVEPAILLFMAVCAHVQSTRMAKRGDEKEHLRRRLADLNPPLAEIDLQLLSRRRLKPHRRSRRRHKFATQWRDRA